MQTDYQLALACSDIYNSATVWDKLLDIEEDIVGIRVSGNDVTIVFRGSDDLIDWWRDIAESVYIQTPIGHVHEGFYAGMNNLYPVIMAFIESLHLVNPKVYITGHSLGAARAWILGAMMIKGGFLPAAVVPLAPPNPGYADFCTILSGAGVPLRWYHNEGDPVPDVPEPILDLMPCMQPCPVFLYFKQSPSDFDLEPLRCHHIELYVAGVLAAETLPQSIVAPKG